MPRVQSARYSLRAALDEFDEQQHKEVDFASILKKCTSAKALQDGQRVHAQIKQRLYDRQTFLGNLIVHMYCRCGRPEDAFAAFRSITEKNVYSWNIMIAAYAQNGLLFDAQDMFDKMPQRDVVSWNHMITVYSQQGYLEHAKAVFEEADHRDVVSWNALIAAYAQYGHGGDALRLYRLMQLEGGSVNAITITGAMEACAINSDFSEGLAIHSSILNSPLSEDFMVKNSLINMYGKCGSIKDAKKIFDEMPYKSVVSFSAVGLFYAQSGQLHKAEDMFERMPQHDTVSWNAMIAVYAQMERLQKARKMFEQLPYRDNVSWTTMLIAYAEKGHLTEANDLFHEMVHRDNGAWNSIISAHVLNNLGSEALRLFRMMEVEGVMTNRVTFISVIHACAIAPSIEVGRFMHAESLHRFKSDVTMVAMLVSVYGRCGQLEEARRLFEAVPHAAVLPWNAMIGSYAHNGHGKRALELFLQMNVSGVRADEVTFTSVLAACSHTGLGRAGRNYFISMQEDYNIESIVDHYGCLIDLLGRTGQLEKAEDLLHHMPFQPDRVIMTSLLGSCRVHRDAPRAAQIAQCLLKMFPSRSSPYALLSNTYVEESSKSELTLSAEK